MNARDRIGYPQPKRLPLEPGDLVTDGAGTIGVVREVIKRTYRDANRRAYVREYVYVDWRVGDEQ